MAAHAAAPHFHTLTQLFLFILVSLSAFLFLLLFFSSLTLKTEETLTLTYDSYQKTEKKQLLFHKIMSRLYFTQKQNK